MYQGSAQTKTEAKEEELQGRPSPNGQEAPEPEPDAQKGAPQKRREDRRARYTKNIIKEALLTLIGKKGFDKISIAELCKLAEISRTTFYLHYDKLTDVLDELVVDALGAAGANILDPSGLGQLASKMRKTPKIEEFMDYIPLLPICQRAADHPKYHAMFLDESASHYILMSIYHKEREKSVPEICKAYHLSESQADALFLFSLTGGFAVNRSCHWEKNQEWFEKQKALMTFLAGGFDALQKL